MSESADPYSVLGLKEGATRPGIVRAYRSMVRRYHPDTATALVLTPGSRTIESTALVRIMESQEVLLNPPIGTEIDRVPQSSTPRTHHVAVHERGNAASGQRRPAPED